MTGRGSEHILENEIRFQFDVTDPNMATPDLLAFAPPARRPPMAHPLPTPQDVRPAPTRLFARPEDGVRLCEMTPGQCGLITHVDRDHVSYQRLLALGFVPGSEIKVIRRAPLGDPVEYQVRSTRICLRESEASLIRIRNLDDE